MPCLECAKLFQVNQSRYEGGQKSFEKEGIINAKWNTLSLNNQVPGTHSTGAELFFPVTNDRVLAHQAGIRHCIGSLALAPL